MILIKRISQLILNQFALCKHGSIEPAHSCLEKLLVDWEALRVDGGGQIYLLQEHSEAIIVLDRELEKISAVLNFDLLDILPKKVRKSGQKFQVMH